MKTYSELLQDPRWQRKRLQIMDRDGWKCRQCNEDRLSLHVHHIQYEKGRLPWEYPDSNLITLCFKCHDEKHKKHSGTIVMDGPVEPLYNFLESVKPINVRQLELLQQIDIADKYNDAELVELLQREYIFLTKIKNNEIASWQNRRSSNVA